MRTTGRRIICFVVTFRPFPTAQAGNDVVVVDDDDGVEYSIDDEITRAHSQRYVEYMLALLLSFFSFFFTADESKGGRLDGWVASTNFLSLHVHRQQKREIRRDREHTHERTGSRKHARRRCCWWPPPTRQQALSKKKRRQLAHWLTCASSLSPPSCSGVVACSLFPQRLAHAHGAAAFLSVTVGIVR